MDELKIEGVEEMVEKQVKNGIVTGLTKWEGRTVNVLIMKEY